MNDMYACVFYMHVIVLFDIGNLKGVGVLT